jgi:hypothetical protein
MIAHGHCAILQPWFRSVAIFLATFGSHAPLAEESSERTRKKRTEFRSTASTRWRFFFAPSFSYAPSSKGKTR